jgi:hypothetical protein
VAVEGIEEAAADAEVSPAPAADEEMIGWWKITTIQSTLRSSEARRRVRSSQSFWAPWL